MFLHIANSCNRKHRKITVVNCTSIYFLRYSFEKCVNFGYPGSYRSSIELIKKFTKKMGENISRKNNIFEEKKIEQSAVW